MALSMKKSLLLFLFSLGVGLNTLAATGDSFSYTYEGQTVNYTIISEDDLTVETKSTPRGDLLHYNSGDLILPETVDYKGKIYTVTEIGYCSFFQCSNLKTVKLPASLKRISMYAFESCSSLEEVEIPASLSYIGSDAFAYCSKLKHVDIKNINSWLKIEFGSEYSNPLYYVHSLYLDGSEVTEVKVPDSITAINNYAFIGCTSLTKIELPQKLQRIGYSSFEGCTGLTKIEFPEALKTIGSSSFEGCANINQIEIPASVTDVGSKAFANCTNLDKIVLESKELPIGEMAFTGCNSLKEINCLSENPPTITSETFSDYNALLTIPGGSWKDYMVTPWGLFLNAKEGDTEIGTLNDQVFTYRYMLGSGEAILIHQPSYKNMTSVSIPDRVVVENGGDASFYQVIGVADESFRGCDKIAQLKLPANGRFIGNSAFEACKSLKTLDIPSQVSMIGQRALYECEALSDIHIPNSITSIDDYVFYGCKSLSKVNIPSSVTSIGNYTFGECSSMIEINIPNSVTSIGRFALAVTNLQEIVFPESLTSVPEYILSRCNNLKRVIIPNSVLSIGNGAFGYCDSLKYVQIPESVTYIGSSAFYFDRSLPEIVIPNSVTEIGYSAFSDCTNLSKVTLSNSITSLPENCFKLCPITTLILNDGDEDIKRGNNCINTDKVTYLYLGRKLPAAYPSLQTLEIGPNIKEITSNDEFSYNDDLTSLTISPSGSLKIGYNAFKYCKGLTEVIIPESVYEIGNGAFSYTSLTEVIVPNAIIGDNAFEKISGLKRVVLGAGVESVGEYAFSGANSLEGVYSTSLTPPAAQNTTFSYYESPLYVPQSAIDTYYNNPRCWYRFAGKPLVLPEKLEVTQGERQGNTIQLNAKLEPSDVSLPQIYWHSTNPAVASVDNNGLVTIHGANAEIQTYAMQQCEIIASSLYDNGPIARVVISADPDSSIEDIIVDNFGNSTSVARPNDIYNLSGVCLKRNATQADIDALAPGFYIIGGKKMIVK